MNLRDPFLNGLRIVLDRAAVWLTLTLVCFMVLWAVVWQRGLQLPWTLAMQQLQDVFVGDAQRLTWVLLWLTLAVAVLSTTALCMLLFTRWRRQGELRAGHMRGPRLEK
jgi:hypothetical protein